MSKTKMNSSDLVAHWDVALSDGVHKIQFEHGTTSGKRVIYIDGKVSVNLHFISVVGMFEL